MGPLHTFERLDIELDENVNTFQLEKTPRERVTVSTLKNQVKSIHPM
jgi:hypothetical protein